MEKFKLKKNNGKNKHSALRAMSFFTTGKKFIKILILVVAIITVIGSFTKSTFAEVSAIQFQNTPLFGETSFAPGNSVSRWVKITNNTETAHRAIVRALSVNNDDNFGDVVILEIKQGSTVIYNDTFSEFFAEPEIILPQVGVGETNTIDFIATFIPESGNEYQEKTMNFSLNIGLEDVEESTDIDTTTIGSLSGSRVTFGQKLLSISNENATPIGEVVGDVTISWNTNIPATSQVIYGLTSGGPYNLDLTAPNYGYPFSNIEDETKVINHSMLLTGLTPGATYVYRVVSRASPATVSYEHQFTVPIPTQVNADNGLVLGATTENNTGGRQGDVLGASTEDDGGDISSGNILGASALPLSGNISSLCSIIALLILILIYLVWELWLRKRYEKLGIKEAIIKNRFYLFFGGCSFVAIIVCIIIVKYCPIPILLIATIISAGFYAYRGLRFK